VDGLPPHLLQVATCQLEAKQNQHKHRALTLIDEDWLGGRTEDPKFLIAHDAEDSRRTP